METMTKAERREVSDHVFEDTAPRVKLLSTAAAEILEEWRTKQGREVLSGRITVCLHVTDGLAVSSVSCEVSDASFVEKSILKAHADGVEVEFE